MIRELVKDILWSKKRKLIQRNFDPQMFLSKSDHEEFTKKGYALIKNVLTSDEIDRLLSLFNDIKTKKEFESPNHYRNSLAFRDAGIKKYIREHIQQIADPILARIIDTSKAIFPLGGGFCINPPKGTRGSPPHQDPTMFDEVNSYAMTTWIALTDMTKRNGCLHMLPSSHLWGNIHRSVTMEWAFTNYKEQIWEHMEPIEMKAGDILCFDVSTIHGSASNQTDDTRLAVNFVTLPKGKQMINYFPVAKNKFNPKLEIYNIDEDYFLKESQYERPSDKYPLIKTFKIDNYYTYKNIQELIQEHKLSRNKNINHHNATQDHREFIR